MKKIIWFVVAILILGAVSAGGFFFYKNKKGDGGLLSGLGKADGMTWQYQKNILEPIKEVGGKEKDIKLGELEKDKVSLQIPKGSFDSEMEIALANPDSVPNYAGEEIDTIGAPIEITAGGGSARLNEKATVSFNFDKNALPAGTDVSMLRVAYYDGKRWEYIKPISVDMEKGVAVFETYHFSFFGMTKVKDEAVITENWVHSKTADKQIRDGLNNLSDKVSEQIVDMTLEKMGISDKSIKGKILGDLLKDDGYKEIYDAYNKGETVDMSQKIAVLAGKKIAENVPESVWQAGLKNLTEGTEDVAAVAKAAGYAAEGQYGEAAKIIGEQIADKFLITTAGKIAVEVVNGQIESWKNGEVEAAYYAFNNGSNNHFYGYNVDKGDFDSVWDQMRGIRRQLEIEAIKKENDARSEAGMPPLSEKQMDRVRESVKDSYKKQFAIRAEKEKEFAAEAEKLRMLVDAYKKANFFDSTFGPVGLDKGLDYENKLDVLYHFAQKMMKDTKRFDLSGKTGLIMDKAISVEDIVQGARYWFSGPNGKKDYQKFLKDRFNIDFYPELKDLAGPWQNGKMVITNVIIPEALKNKPKSKESEELGCDFSMDLTQLIGKEVSISLEITPQGENSGTLKFKSDDSDGKSVPFTYEDGMIKASFSEKGAVATISLEISDDETNYLANGSMNIVYKTEEGEAKILTTLTASKAMKPAPVSSDKKDDGGVKKAEESKTKSKK